MNSINQASCESAVAESSATQVAPTIPVRRQLSNKPRITTGEQTMYSVNSANQASCKSAVAESTATQAAPTIPVRRQLSNKHRITTGEQPMNSANSANQESCESTAIRARITRFISRFTSRCATDEPRPMPSPTAWPRAAFAALLMAFAMTTLAPNNAAAQLSFGDEIIDNQEYLTGQPVDLTLPAATGGTGPYTYDLLRGNNTDPVLVGNLTFNGDLTTPTITGVPTAGFNAIGASSLIYEVVDSTTTTFTSTFGFRVRDIGTTATLSGLTLADAAGTVLTYMQSGATATTFAAGTFAYTATVPASTTAVTVGAPATDSNANVVITGTAALTGTAADSNRDLSVADGVVSGLTVGDNIINIAVTSENRATTQDYVITLTVSPPASDATLSALTLFSASTALTFSPAFNTGTYAYAVTALRNITAVTVNTYTPTDSNATAEITGTAAPVAPATTGDALTVEDNDDVIVVSGLTEGANTLTITVTAADTTTTQAYTITLTVPAASMTDATLSALTLTDAGTDIPLSPVFAAAVLTYTATAPSSSLTTVTVGYTPTNSNAATTFIVSTGLTVDLATGVVSGLAEGTYTLTTRVTAQNGTDTEDYVITLTVPAASDVDDLSALSLADDGTAITLTPELFDAAVFTYTATAPSSSLTTVTVSYTPANSNAATTFSVSGPGTGLTVDLATGVVSGLTVGTYTLTTRVTAENGTDTEDYVITLTVPAASDVDDLSALSLADDGTAITLTPAFAAGTFAYTATAPRYITAVTVNTYTPTDSNATVEITGTAAPVAPATTGVAITGDTDGVVSGLTPGANTITITVTAEDGTMQTYTITLTVPKPSTSTILSTLALTAAGTDIPLTYTFATLTYSATAPRNIRAVTVNAPAHNGRARVVITGTDAAGVDLTAPVSGDGEVSGLTAGVNTLTMRATAEDGTTTQDYVVMLTVPAIDPADGTLSALTLTGSSGDIRLSPAFAAGTFAYTASVERYIANVTVTATPNNGAATYTITGTAANADGTAGDTALTVTDGLVTGLASGTTVAGINTITVTVFPADGTTSAQSYVIMLTVEPVSPRDATLSALTLANDIPLDPAFAFDTTNYTATVPSGTTNVTVTATPNNGAATYTITGTNADGVGLGVASSVVTGLTVGDNTINIEVTSMNGSVMENYVITITVLPSMVATLSGLTLDAGTYSIMLSPEFNSGTTAYTATAPSSNTEEVTVGITTTDSEATVAIDGTTLTGTAGVVSGLTAGVVSGLTAGDNMITVTVIAEDGTTTQDYLVTLTVPTDAIVSEELNEQLLSRASMAMTASVSARVAARVEAAAGSDGINGGDPSALAYQFGGQSSMGNLLQAHGKSMLEGEMDYTQLLDGASFVMPLSAAGDEGGKLGGLSLWGGADLNNLEGDAGNIDWDGEVVGFHLGVDAPVGNNMLAGLALSLNTASFDYTDNGQSGDYEYSTTNLHPYFGYMHNEKVNFWGAAGFGQGEIEVEADDAEKTATDTSHLSLAGGFNTHLRDLPNVLSGGETTLNIKGDVSMATVDVDANSAGSIAAQEVSSNRIRLLLAGQSRMDTASGGIMTPSLETGVRIDGGDGETGTGLELNAGIDYTNPNGVSVKGGIHTLLGHDGYSESGADFTIRLAPKSGRGLSLSLQPVWGQTQSTTERLWDDGINELADDDKDLRSRMNSEVGYGLATTMLGSTGVLTPYAGMTTADGGVNQMRLGGRFASGTGLRMKLEGARENDGDDASNTVLLRGELAF